jgi:capsid assembly protease
LKVRSLELEHVSATFYGSPWAIVPEKLRELQAIVERRLVGLAPPADDLAAMEKRWKKRLSASEQFPGGLKAEVRNIVGMPVRQYGKVAVMPLYGVISQRMSWMSSFSGGTSTEQFGKAFDQLCADNQTKCIVFDVDSPGGSVSGVQELATKILQARGEKKTYAISNGMMASAAYWIGSAAQECWITPSGMAGSIGVVAMHTDASKTNEMVGRKVSYITAGKYKAEGNPDEPLNDDARAAMQEIVDAFYDSFVKAVAKQRDATETAVRNGFGEARVLTAGAAVKERLVDRVGTLEQLLGKLGADPAGGGPRGSVAEAELALAQT